MPCAAGVVPHRKNTVKNIRGLKPTVKRRLVVTTMRGIGVVPWLLGRVSRLGKGAKRRAQHDLRDDVMGMCFVVLDSTDGYF